MAVTSKPMGSAPAPAPKSGKGPEVLGKLGIWLAVISFGGVFWAINGGFSVIGLGVLASSFNDAGRLFWAMASSLTFTLPVNAPGLPTTQPIVPWVGVIAASCLQISVAWLRLSGRRVPATLLMMAILLSLYDYVTTFYGLGTVSWIAVIGWPLQALIAIPLTFALETAIGFALRR